MKIWKRNAVIAIVAVFVCVAVYLNWSYEKNVEDALADYAQFEDTTTGKLESEELSAGNSSGGDYFSSARLSRTQSRSQALTMLQESVSTDSASQEIKDSVVMSIEGIANDSMVETQIENLIIAQGYADCVAFINDGEINIVVSAPAEGLTGQDVAKINDIVFGNTDLSAGDITIIEVRS